MTLVPPNLLLVKVIPNTNYLYSTCEYIYKVEGFVKSDRTYAILSPFLKPDWSKIILIPNNKKNTRRIIEVEIEYLDMIHESEIPQDVLRDFKLSSIGI